ncbi:MAG: glycosyltransferase, partial [Planctomycetota bacterium JB042]
MRIVMMTNSFRPHVNGVARSVEAFTREFRRAGHEVLVIAPEHADASDEYGVLRIPALQSFTGNDFSVALPVPSGLHDGLERFAPDVVHSHHPYLVGDAALRLSRRLGVGLVFTHHTMYEHYAQYVSDDAPSLRRFVKRLSTGYANLTDLVIAPSASVKEVLAERGVETRIEVVPTGVRLEDLDVGSGEGLRQVLGIPPDAPVVGHLGRLAPEKNLGFLLDAVERVLAALPRAQFVLAGAGRMEKAIGERLAAAGLGARFHPMGVVSGKLLASVYKAMDVFAFASKSETQGMVLIEAMACRAPVVALDAPGAREAVRDGENGRLVGRESVEAFAAALRSVLEADGTRREALREGARRTAEELSLARTARRMVDLYSEVVARGEPEDPEESAWAEALERFRTEWRLIRNAAEAAGAAMFGPDEGDEDR